MVVHSTDLPLRVLRTDPTSAIAEQLLRSYFAELTERAHREVIDIDTVLRAEPSDNLAGDTGVFLLVVAGREPVGCGGLRFITQDLAELTRVYVVPTARGKGVGSFVLDALEEEATQSGRLHIRLDTRLDLCEAIRLYERRGYRACAPFSDGPYAEMWMERRLDMVDATIKRSPPSNPARNTPAEQCASSRPDDENQSRHRANHPLTSSTSSTPLQGTSDEPVQSC